MELYTREGNRIRHSLLCELEENIFLAHGSLSLPLFSSFSVFFLSREKGIQFRSFL